MTLDKITTVLNKGGQHLGDLIWWTLSDAKIDRSTLENIWTGAQLVTTGEVGPPDHRNHRAPVPPPVIWRRFFAPAVSA